MFQVIIFIVSGHAVLWSSYCPLLTALRHRLGYSQSNYLTHDWILFCHRIWLYSQLQLGVHSVVFPMLWKQVCERSAIGCGGRKWRVFQHLMCLKCVPRLQTLTREHGFRYLCPPHRKRERLDIQKTPAAWTPAKYLSLSFFGVVFIAYVNLCCVRLDGVQCKINVSTKSFLENDKYLLSASRQKYPSYREIRPCANDFLNR